MEIGAGAGPQFAINAEYKGLNSNMLNFELEAGPGDGIVIMPSDLTVDPWLGSVGISDQVPPYQLGTTEHPFVLHDSTFNPDDGGDGTFDFEFALIAKDGAGYQIDNDQLSWGRFPPFVALDIDDASKGTFHANQFSVGYVFAQDLTFNQSNHLYVEVMLDQN
jgi:hypothetical protein